MNIMADDQYDAPNKVQVLLEYLHERELDLEEMAERKRLKLEQCYQLRILIADAEQVGFRVPEGGVGGRGICVEHLERTNTANVRD